MGQFNTKFSVGDTVWVMFENRPTTMIVLSVSINHSKYWNAPKISYGMEDSGITLQEDSVFATKKELLDSFI